ncbi:indole-3-acetaldehyde oxidase-like isoform X1 [Tribolium madens]|uniref:indole-3-acetaldehyde oxidase-like isoform X1 n=2 Tax=Tribolium madens TaxID=41895 RepID=UPI001CF749C4|nr:indole-3-acetaldehyde oxidase-like isoform X1 [Tribolium madens]
MGTTQSVLEDLNLPKIKKLEEIRFYLHDTEHVVKTDSINPNTTLNSYLRQNLNLTGTKAMCHEGGCGACVVVIQKKDSITQKDTFLSVNSCLIPILSCNGWRVYTVEGIGSPLLGYHPVQQILAKFNGTQCGFCSPGMVMNMYALYESGNLTIEEVENSFGGNICRCTGYRSILAAFKSLCTDSCPEILGQHPDIEDLRVCQRNSCEKKCEKISEEPFYHVVGSSRWIKVYTLRDLFTTLSSYSSLNYKLIAGNTAQGVFKTYSKPVDLYVDVTSIPELISHDFKNNSLVLGANTTLTKAIEVFIETSKKYPNFVYLKDLAQHIDLIANVPVRNKGTLAGNLMMKHDHNDFPSDIFLIMETVGVQFTIVSVNGQEVTLSPLDFIKSDMKLKILQNIVFPEYTTNVKFVSYKIMPRAQNTHAHVNAGFLFKFENDLIQEARIIYGNINPTLVHAIETEKFLVGKHLFDNSVLQQAYGILSTELDPNLIPPDPSPEFRKQLAIALFYKAILTIAPSDKISLKNKSGGSLLQRPISKGVQDYDTKKSLYPLTQPISKLEALAQTTGQAQYIDDMPDLPNQLFGALVLAESPPNSIIKSINSKKALEQDDIVAFFSKDDIPGDNNFTPLNIAYITAKEEIFCSGRVQYYEQPIGILVGKNFQAVQAATKLVEVTYDVPNIEPLLSVRQILKSGRKDRILETKTIKPKRRGNDIKYVIKGTFDIHHQYHFHMETQCCNVIPTEDGLDIYPSSQWMDLTQISAANMLKIPNNKINVFVRRCGGAFGAKISRNGLVSCAAALASWKLRKPVKLSLSLSTNIAVIGKRWPLSTDYEVGVNDKGVIQYLDCTHYSDVGAISNEDGTGELLNLFMASYDPDTFHIQMNKAITDTHTNTWARAPGTTEGLAAIEAIIEHISYVASVDPLEVRLANFPKDSPLVKYVNDIKSWADIDKRKSEINTFNQNNRWKKKGLSVVPMNYELNLAGPFAATVSIFHGDGSVQISHGGIEIGQGINTKAAQVCAYKLGISLEKISVIPSNSFVAPNSMLTGSSITSEAVCYGVIQACDQLLDRIKPYRKKFENVTWEELIQKCFEDYVNLSASGQFSPKEKNVTSYSIYGICACEVLVDILTGQHIVSRVDLIEDTGQSMSPEIDIGQIEGAFVMGMGYYTMEHIIFNYEGKILTNNTWTYHPPGAKDIPVDFNVKFPKNNPNPVGVLKSKATGEPAVCLTIAVPLAIRNAVASARLNANSSNTKWFPFDGPTNVENVFMNSLNDYSQYVL